MQIRGMPGRTLHFVAGAAAGFTASFQSAAQLTRSPAAKYNRLRSDEALPGLCWPWMSENISSFTPYLHDSH